MKKLLVLIMAMLFVASIASASTLKMSGNYYVKGTWYDNEDGTDGVEPVESYGQYDHEMTLDMVFAMTPYTKVVAKLELRDEIWGVSTGATEVTTANAQEGNIVVEEVYGQHTFMNHHTVIVGLVKTQTWSTDFDNNKIEAFRVNYVFPTPLGTAFVYTEKYQPSYALGGRETLGTDADTDAYVAAIYSKIGSVNVQPLFAYIDAEGFNPLFGGALDFSLLKADLGLGGTINNIGWEAELIYVDYNYDTKTAAGADRDYAIWGAHLHAWTQMDALKLGVVATYGSYDEDVDKGFAFGTEYDGGSDSLMPGRTMLLGDEVNFASFSATASTIASATLLSLYGTYNINEKASLTLLGAYVDSNVELPAGHASDNWDGATAYEVNIIGEYKITPLLKYAAGAALAQVEYGDGSVDPDAAIEISHKLSFTF